MLACTAGYEGFRRRSILGSLVIHGVFVASMLVAVRQPPPLAPSMREYVVHLVEVPPAPVERPAAATVPQPAPLPLPSERIRRTVSPALRRPELPRTVTNLPEKSFNEDAYRAALEKRLQSADLARQPLSGSSGSPSERRLSPEEYRAYLESRLASSAQPSVQPRTTNRVALPEIPRIASEEPLPAAPAVSSAPAVGVQMGTSVPAWYVEAIRRRLEQNWKFGQKSGLLDDRALVSFSINRNGTVTGIYLEERSRIPAFDQSALEAVRHSVPLPPLPAEVKSETLDVTVEFSARGVR